MARGLAALGPSLVLLPVILVAQLAFTVGVGLLAASLTVYLRDLEHFVGLGLMAWFYLTPIIYPLDPTALPRAPARYLPWFQLNPMTWYVESFHAVLFAGRWPAPMPFALMLASAVVALVAGYGLFVRLRPRLPHGPRARKPSLPPTLMPPSPWQPTCSPGPGAMPRPSPTGRNKRSPG